MYLKWFLTRNPVSATINLSGYWFPRAARQKSDVFRRSVGFLVWVTGLRAQLAKKVVFLEFLGVSALALAVFNPIGSISKKNLPDPCLPINQPKIGPSGFFFKKKATGPPEPNPIRSNPGLD